MEKNPDKILKEFERIVAKDKIQNYLDPKFMEMSFDWMMVKKHEKISSLITMGEQNNPKNMIPFEILNIGPGYLENGTFVKTTHKIGDWVFINGAIMRTDYNDCGCLFARARDITCKLLIKP